MKALQNISKEYEINRLIDQARCWEPETESLINKIDIQQGWNCIDVGCGPVGVLPSLCKMVGVQGQVTGVDHNPHYIKAANQFIRQNKLTNARAIKVDFFENTFNPGIFDLSHMRFVFTEVGCDREILEKSILLTRPGGVVISQESDWTTWKCYPPQPAWTNILQSLIELFKLKGGDINAGLRTYQMFKEADFSEPQIRTVILAMPAGNQYRAGLVRFALSMRNKIIAAKILTKEQFSKNIEDCNEIINNPNIIIFSYTLAQVWGRVKKQ
jgi:ubiquinone/menaquinone biosynthesis C-methylase UbiE